MIGHGQAAEIIATAEPRMRRAGVTTNDGKGGRPSSGRTNDLTWMAHDHCLPVPRTTRHLLACLR